MMQPASLEPIFLQEEIVEENHTQCGTPECCGSCDTATDETTAGNQTASVAAALQWREIY